MDSKDDITVQILVDIRDEIRSTNQRLDTVNHSLNSRIDGLNDSLGQRIDGLNDSLSQRITHSEIRLATAIVDLHGTVSDVKTMLGQQLDLRDRVAKCELEIAELKRKNKKPE